MKFKQTQPGTDRSRASVHPASPYHRPLARNVAGDATPPWTWATRSTSWPNRQCAVKPRHADSGIVEARRWTSAAPQPAGRLATTTGDYRRIDADPGNRWDYDSRSAPIPDERRFHQEFGFPDHLPSPTHHIPSTPFCPLYHSLNPLPGPSSHPTLLPFPPLYSTLPIRSISSYPLLPSQSPVLPPPSIHAPPRATPLDPTNPPNPFSY